MQIFEHKICHIILQYYQPHTTIYLTDKVSYQVLLKIVVYDLTDDKIGFEFRT